MRTYVNYKPKKKKTYEYLLIIPFSTSKHLNREKL